MDAEGLRAALHDLALGEVVFQARTGSTNDDAARLAEAGSPDLTLVVADEQVSGRGRLGRRWLTPAGSALAFSLALRLGAAPAQPWRYTALGALAVCGGLQDCCGLEAAIKWPNDVLLGGRKVAGVLAEASWQQDTLVTAILGVGVNVTAASVPADDELLFPATSVEASLGRAVDRLTLLRAILASLLAWRSEIDTEAFWQAWEQRLAFRGEMVQIVPGYGQTPGGEGKPLTGRLLGADEEGRLRLQADDGSQRLVAVGDLCLRPLQTE